MGTNSAVFFPGDELRCPALLRGSNDRRCSTFLNLWSGPQHQTIVRKRMALPYPTGEKPLDGQCWKCHERLEIFSLPETRG